MSRKGLKHLVELRESAEVGDDFLWAIGKYYRKIKDCLAGMNYGLGTERDSLGLECM